MTTTTDNENNLFSIEEFAKRNGVCKATVYNFVHRGILPVTKLGRRSWISRKSEEEFLNSLTTGGPEVLNYKKKRE